MTENFICQICESCTPKYKCPSCLIRYCSVACYKSHKSETSNAATKCSTPQPSEMASNPGKNPSSLIDVAPEVLATPAPPVHMEKLLLPTQDTVPPDRLEELRNSSELRTLLQSQDLRSQLQDLASCTTGPEAAPLLDNWLRENRDFRRFADVCLNIVAPERNTYREDWTQDENI
ncbi:zinc finger HIT domain-containing protein 3 [Hyalella azteca]|uniref:Zinc finger HIT domain-containing protein 3 n=1 Tax=Hyalella azteca TaxID=294128 RepID=A0A8B7PGT4_HYAAZ|nr:zinc finger HIT domain-containing protein 3 [Hyalella azteca]